MLCCGRGYLVVAACCSINAFTLAVVRSGAGVYVGIAGAFGVSKEDASWPLTLATVFNLALGRGLSLLTFTYVAVNKCMPTNKALASGITISGSVIRGIIFPPVVQCLFDAYGAKGGLLVFGAIMLNSLVAAYITRGPLSEAGRRGTKTMSNGTTTAISETANTTICAARAEDQLHGDNNYDSYNSTCFHIHEGTTETAKATSSGFGDIKGTSMWRDVSGTSSSDLNINVCRKSTESKLSRSLSFLKNPRFYIIAYSLGQTWFVNTTLLTVVADFALDRGIANWDAVSLVSFITAPDLASRFVSGIITDRVIVQKSSMKFLWLTALACSHIATPHISSFAAIATLVAICGVCSGIAGTHIFILCSELVDPSTFSLCLGAANIVAAFALLERPLMIRYFKDKLGSYDGLFYIMGGVSATTADLWLIVRFQERKKNTHGQNEDALAECS